MGYLEAVSGGPPGSFIIYKRYVSRARRMRTSSSPDGAGRLSEGGRPSFASHIHAAVIFVEEL
jgi:hypothetical protein